MSHFELKIICFSKWIQWKYHLHRSDETSILIDAGLSKKQTEILLKIFSFLIIKSLSFPN
jgi:hypothetical protein